MTVYYPLHYRSAHAELARERGQTLPGLAPLPSTLRVRSAAVTYLIGLLSGQFRIYAALLVHELRDRLHMRRIDAAGITAEMVDLESGEDLPNELLIEVPVGGDETAACSIPKFPVALSVRPSLEDPAFRCESEIFLDIPLIQRYRFSAVDPSIVAVNETSRVTLPMGVDRRRVNASVIPAAALTKTHIPTLTRALEARL